MTTVAHVPNDVLRAVRIGLRLSQDDLARALRRVGDELGEPNDASKRLVQRWESGISRSPRPVYARALERLTGKPVEALGFSLPVPRARVRADSAGGHDLEPGPEGVAEAVGTPQPTAQAGLENYSGVWLSRYEFYSSGRDGTFSAEHYVVLVQHGIRLTAQSLPGASSNPDSPLSLDLTVDRNVVTGTWTEQTAADGYYQGARYHGALQLLVEPTGRRMAGKWVGFGKDFDVNSGPWELRLWTRRPVSPPWSATARRLRDESKSFRNPLVPSYPPPPASQSQAIAARLRGGSNMARYGTRSGGIRRGLLALTFAAGLLLTGCSGSGGNMDSADQKGGANKENGSAPLPGVPQQSGGPAEGDQGEQADKSKDFAPPPDYLSTFALDVDTASYGFARRTLAEGRLPDPSTVRPEEFVNSFRQDYDRPEGNGFTVTIDGAAHRPRRLVPAPRRASPPGARRPTRRTPARRPHLRHRHLRLHGRTGPARPRPGSPWTP